MRATPPWPISCRACGLPSRRREPWRCGNGRRWLLSRSTAGRWRSLSGGCSRTPRWHSSLPVLTSGSSAPGSLHPTCGGRVRLEPTRRTSSFSTRGPVNCGLPPRPRRTRRPMQVSRRRSRTRLREVHDWPAALESAIRWRAKTTRSKLRGWCRPRSRTSRSRIPSACSGPRTGMQGPRQRSSPTRCPSFPRHAWCPRRAGPRKCSCRRIRFGPARNRRAVTRPPVKGSYAIRSGIADSRPTTSEPSRSTCGRPRKVRKRGWTGRSPNACRWPISCGGASRCFVRSACGCASNSMAKTSTSTRTSTALPT